MSITLSGSNVQASDAYQSGTATSATTTTISDTSKTFDSTYIGRYVYIFAGTGADQQTRRITAQTATQLTVSEAWAVTPDSTSQYMVGYNGADCLAASIAGGWGVVSGDSTARQYKFTGGLILPDNTWSFFADRCASFYFGASCAWRQKNIVQFGEMFHGSPVAGCLVRWASSLNGVAITPPTAGDTGRWLFYDTMFMLDGTNVRIGDAGGYWKHDWRQFRVGRDPALGYAPAGTGTIYGICYLGQNGVIDGYRVYGISLAIEVTGNFVTGPISNLEMFDIGAGGFYTYNGNGEMSGVQARNFAVGGYPILIYPGRNQTLKANDSKVLSTDIRNTAGTVQIYKNVTNYLGITGGGDLAGANVAWLNKNIALQGSVTASDASGNVAAIKCLTLDSISNVKTDYNPVYRRIRKYGYEYSDTQFTLNNDSVTGLSLADFVKVESSVTLSSAAAAAITGVTITDHGGSPVPWNGKSWGITITGDLTTNPGLTLSDLKHYIYYVIGQAASVGGKSGMLWHDMIPIYDNVTERGRYSASLWKGVRVVDQAGNPFPGVVSMQSDDGSYYNPPVSVSYTVSGMVSGSRLLLRRTDTLAVLYNGVPGTSYSYNYSWSADLPIEVIVRKASSAPFYQEWRTTATLTSTNGGVTANQLSDEG